MSHIILIVRVAFGLLVAFAGLLAFGVALYIPLGPDFRFLSFAVVPVVLGIGIGCALSWVGWRLIVPPLRTAPSVDRTGKS